MPQKIKIKKHGDASIIWGILILLAGLMLLLNNLGIVSWNFWDYVWPFWPIILVLTGFQIIFGHNIISRLIVSLCALVFFLLIIIYGLAKTNSNLLAFLPVSWINFIKTAASFK